MFRIVEKMNVHRETAQTKEIRSGLFLNKTGNIKRARNVRDTKELLSDVLKGRNCQESQKRIESEKHRSF